MLDFFNKRGALNVEAIKKQNVFSWPLELEGRDSEGESKGWETGFIPKWEKATFKEIIEWFGITLKK